jgi:hypothetical protein
MTILPYPPRRAWLRGFLLVMISTLTVAVGSLALVVTAWAAVVLVPIAMLSIVGWWSPSLLRIPYRAWNAVAVRVERAMSLAVLLVAYYAVIMPAGWTQSPSTIALRRPGVGQSLWEMYPPSGRSAYFQPYPATDGAARDGWTRHYVKWCLTSANRWMLALLPFLWLLSKVDRRSPRGGVPANIYTVA